MADQKKYKKNHADAELKNAPSAAAMQDLYKKLQSESVNMPSVPQEERVNKSDAPKYDEDRAVSTRKQLMEDYRRELEALGKEEKRAVSRPNLYEYEDLTVDLEEEAEEISVEEAPVMEAEETPVEEAPVEEVEEAPVEEAPVMEEEESPVEEAPVIEEEEAPAEEAPVMEEEEAPVEETPVTEEGEEAPVEEAPVIEEEEEAPAEEALVTEEGEEAPAEEVPVTEEGEEAPAEEAPVMEEEEEAPAEEASVTEEEEAPAEEAPVMEEEESPVEEAPVMEEEESPVEEAPVMEEEEESPTEETPVMEEEETPVTEAEGNEIPVFRPVSPFRRVAEQKDKRVQKIDPSKQKDPYSVYDYDMAQDFGYFPVSRERTVSQENEMDGAREHHITIFSKRESTRTSEPKKKNERYGRIWRRSADAGDDSAKRRRQSGKNSAKSQRKKTIPEPGRISETEDARIRENPKKAKEIALRRVILTGVLAVILFFWEYLPLIPGSGYMLFGVIGNAQYPHAYIVIAALLLLIDAGVLGRSFFGGFRELVALRCTPRSLTAFAIVLSVLNDVFSCYILFLEPDAEYGMFHFSAAIFAFLYALGAYCAVRRKSDAYAVFGAPRAKYMLVEDELCEHIQNRMKEQDGRLRRFIVKGEALGVEKRLSSEERYDSFPGFRRLFFLLILLGMIAMLVSAFLSAGRGSLPSRMAEAVRAFLWTVFLSVPLAVTEVRRFPLMQISKRMRKKNTALAGDAAAAEYAAVSKVAVRSETFFRKHSFTFGECIGSDPARLKYLVSSVFVALGDPFSRAVRSGRGSMDAADSEALYSEDVRLVLVSERIVRAYVSGVLVELRLSDDEKSGYLLSDPGAPLRDTAYRLPLGIAVEGESVGTCSFYVQNDSEYPALVRALHEHGLRIGVCHYTFLSFFNSKTLQVPHVSHMGQLPLVFNLSEDTAASQMQKSGMNDETADSGIAALNAPKDLWLPLVYAEKIASYNRFASVFAWLSIFAGTVLSFLTLFGVLSAAAYPFMMLALPIVSGGLTYLFSNYYLS